MEMDCGFRICFDRTTYVNELHVKSPPSPAKSKVLCDVFYSMKAVEAELSLPD
jgi:hypothetical protein